jgi:hypothetical protein
MDAQAREIKTSLQMLRFFISRYQNQPKVAERHDPEGEASSKPTIKKKTKKAVSSIDDSKLGRHNKSRNVEAVATMRRKKSASVMRPYPQGDSGVQPDDHLNRDRSATSLSSSSSSSAFRKAKRQEKRGSEEREALSRQKDLLQAAKELSEAMAGLSDTLVTASSSSSSSSSAQADLDHSSPESSLPWVTIQITPASQDTPASTSTLEEYLPGITKAFSSWSVGDS